MEKPPKRNKEYEKEKRKAKALYSTIGRVWCPVLNEDVNFNRVGFGHLIKKGMRPRAMNDQIRRFRLLKHAQSVVCNEGSLFLQRTKENKPSLRASFWAVAQWVDDQFVVVVIRQTKTGQKHFFSIYDQKTAQ